MIFDLLIWYNIFKFVDHATLKNILLLDSQFHNRFLLLLFERSWIFYGSPVYYKYYELIRNCKYINSNGSTITVAHPYLHKAFVSTSGIAIINSTSLRELTFKVGFVKGELLPHLTRLDCNSLAYAKTQTRVQKLVLSCNSSHDHDLPLPHLKSLCLEKIAFDASSRYINISLATSRLDDLTINCRTYYNFTKPVYVDRVKTYWSLPNIFGIKVLDIYHLGKMDCRNVVDLTIGSFSPQWSMPSVKTLRLRCYSPNNNTPDIFYLSDKNLALLFPNVETIYLNAIFPKKVVDKIKRARVIQIL